MLLSMASLEIGPKLVWLQALEESRRRLALQQRDGTRIAALDKERLELRSHVRLELWQFLLAVSYIALLRDDLNA
jgi:hypothetical protein